jgi:hypothetical protein
LVCVVQVIELKGNIRVLARIRPMIEKERSAACSEGGGVQEAVRASDEETVVLDAANGPREFSFDRVFGPSDGQSAVYEEVSGIVTSVMDGYNACIMAYGQTGSGKTFTLEGESAALGGGVVAAQRGHAGCWPVCHQQGRACRLTQYGVCLSCLQAQQMTRASTAGRLLSCSRWHVSVLLRWPTHCQQVWWRSTRSRSLTC